VKGPPITVSCVCGEVRHVPYGETWQCERCERRWNTAQIPSDVYWGIMRDMRNYRLIAIGSALSIALVIGVLALVFAVDVLLLLPPLFIGWFVWFMPLWRRKLRRRARNLPRWKLTPEEPGASV
jgi:hypothetical protein